MAKKPISFDQWKNSGAKPVTFDEWKNSGATLVSPTAPKISSTPDPKVKTPVPISTTHALKIAAPIAQTPPTQPKPISPNQAPINKTPGQTNPQPTQNGTPPIDQNGEDYTSEEDQAKAMLQGGRDAQIDQEKKLFGEGLTPTTQDDEVKLFLDKQAEEKTALQTQIEKMNKIDQSQFDMSKKDAGASVAGVEARYAQSQEGVMSAGNPMISKAFSQRTNERINIAQTQLDMKFTERENLKKQLDEAQKNGKKDLANQINTQLAGAENQIREQKLKMAEYADHARTEAFGFLEKAPAGALAGMDAATVSQSLGVDGMTASMLINMDNQKITLQQKQFEMDDADYALKMSDIEKNIATTKFAGMTEDGKNFETYKNMVDHDPQGAEDFAVAVGIHEKSFFEDFTIQNKQVQAQKQTIYEKTGVKAPLKSKYAYDITPDGGVSFERSCPSGTKLTTRGECGQFVNDIINGGPGLMSDSFASKMAKVNSQEPVPGSAFVEKVGGATGHTGIVEKTYPDGSFDIRESNYVSTHTVSTAHIAPGSKRWNTIVEQGGFYVPGASQAKDQEVQKEVGTEDVQVEGEPTGESSDFENYARSLAAGDLKIGDLKDLGMSKKDIAMLTSASLKIGKPQSDLSGNYESYADALSRGDMSVADLKALDLKPQDLGAILAKGMDRKATMPKDSGKDYTSGLSGNYQDYAQSIASGDMNLSDLNSLKLNPQDIGAISAAAIKIKQSGAVATPKISTAEEQKLRQKISSSSEAKSINAFNDLKQGIKTYRDLVDKAGAVALNEKNQASINNAYANLKVLWKEAANLGALTGPDLGLLEDAIPNITGTWSFLNKFRSGDAKEGILNAMDAELSRIEQQKERRVELLKNTYPQLENTPLLDQLSGKPSNQNSNQTGGIVNSLKSLFGGSKPAPVSNSPQWSLPEDEFSDVDFDF